MPRARQCAATRETSSSDIVHPVGLPGEFTISSRVSDVSAANKRSRSSRQRRVRGSMCSATRSTRAHDRRHRRQVGPDRRHDDDAVTRGDEGLYGEHQCRHARTRDRDPLGADRRRAGAKRTRIGGDRRAQRRQAEVRRVEGVASVDRRLRGVADPWRGDLGRLAEPEREDVVAPHRRVGDLANERGGEGGDRGRRGDRVCRRRRFVGGRGEWVGHEASGVGAGAARAGASALAGWEPDRL